MDIVIGIIMGIIEGLTEFAPVSSTGHLILAGHLLGFEGNRASTFEIVIQLGSILAVAVIMRKKLLSLVRMNRNVTVSGNKFGLLHILIGMIPFGIGGLLFYDLIKEVLFSPQTVVITLILGGVLMIAAEKLKPTPTAESLEAISYKQALFVGLFQCLALIPGFSRSGATLSGGILSGMSHKTASEFTFIMAIPIMFAASGKDLLENIELLSAADLPLFIAGFISAFLVALIIITFFLKLINRVKLIPFAIYRFVLAVIFGLFLL